jgi:PAS domain S-box-containing protein
MLAAEEPDRPAGAGAEEIRRYDLSAFSLADMYECSTDLRDIGRTAVDADDVARKVVLYFFERFVTPAADRQCVLVRLFRTQAPSCLSLRATRGIRPEWNDPASSKNHRLLPLALPLPHSGMPMVSALVSQLGVPTELISGAADDASTLRPMFDVFHVEHAVGSPYVPDQNSFVAPYGIESVLGFGGALSSSEMFIVLVFANVTIPSSTAQLFKTLAPSVGLALLPEGQNGAVGKARGYEQVLRYQEQVALDRHRQLMQFTEQLNASLEERREAEISLREREEFLRAIIETTPECVKLVSRDGTLLMINVAGAQKIGASAPEQVVGVHASQLVAPEHLEAYQAFNARTCDGTKGSFEFDILTLDRKRRTMESHAVPLRMGDATVQLAVTRDVTDHRAAEAALRDASRRKDEFIATLSHELRNPLASLQNAVTLMGARKLDEEASSRVREIMDRQLGHLTKLVDDLLEVARIDRGVLKLHREPLDLEAVFRNAIETSEALIRGAGHRLDVEWPKGRLWVHGDPVRMVQILCNLLSNAARFTESPGSITLSVEARGSAARISVRDTGIGFAPEAADRIFEMFSKSDGSAGLGIGLALTRRLVELHGGSIAARSEGPGHGAEFVVTLPLAAPPPVSTADITPVQSTPEANLACRVLVADDNHDAAEMLAELLRTLVCEVAVAHDGAEAVALAREMAPDLVLLDIGMPKMDGYAAAECIRRDANGRAVQIVALTGWGQEADVRRTRAAGFDEHLTKPTDFHVLRRILENVTPGMPHAK